MLSIRSSATKARVLGLIAGMAVAATAVAYRPLIFLSPELVFWACFSTHCPGPYPATPEGAVDCALCVAGGDCPSGDGVLGEIWLQVARQYCSVGGGGQIF